MNKKITAVGYIRVSTEEQVEGYSLDNQIERIHRECKHEGWEVLRIFEDRGVSGALLDKRPGLISMLQFLENNTVDYVVIYKLSRLSRKLVDIANIADFLEKRSIYLKSIDDKLDTSSGFGKSFLYISGIFAEIERDNIIVQVKGGMEQKAREGEWNGGSAPLGYNLINKELCIDKEQADVVIHIFSSYLRGNGYKTIAKSLNDQGIKTSRGNAFNGNSVKGILQNPTYAGRIRWGHRTDWNKLNEHNRRERKYSDEAINAEGKHEAIISSEVFQKVQELIENNPRRHMKRFDGKHLLSGVLKCSGCGGGMSYQPATGRKEVYGYYICNQYQNKKTCKPNAIRKEIIEAEFLEIFQQKINEPEFQKIMITSLESPIKQVQDIEKIITIKQDMTERLIKRKDALFDELLQGSEAYKEEIRMQIQNVLDQVSRVNQEISILTQDIIQIKSEKLNVGEIVELLKNIGKVLPLMEKTAQQSLVRRLVTSVQTEDKRISEVQFSFEKNFRIGGGTENRITNKTKSSLIE